MVNEVLKRKMSGADPDQIPQIYRLALAYAPGPSERDIFTLFALEAQFARFVSEANEPIIAQMRLAWWRDRFAEPVSDWPKGNPLLARLSNWGEAARDLQGVVDGWEALLAERPLGESPILAHAKGRATGWLALAKHKGAEAQESAIASAAKRHALVEAAWHWLDEGDRTIALDLARSLPQADLRGKALKPLAVLDALAAKALASDRAPLSRPTDLFVALRRGLLGR